ncbi:MAG: fimbrillin family protein [Bacteroidales bacterium]|nr:fimbrillin family protein [Bacteroidales bacterium]
MKSAPQSESQSEPTFPRDIVLGVHAWEYEPSTSAENGAPLLSNATVAFTEGEWQLSNEAWWPSDGKLLAVVAYAPYTATSAYVKGKGICWEGVDLGNEDTPDLLYSELHSGLRSGIGTVNLPMKHSLSSIDFALKHNAAEGESVAITSLRVEGLRWKGSFQSQPQPTWSAEGDPQGKTFFSGSRVLNYESAVVGSTLPVIPQSLAGGSVTIGITSTREGFADSYELTGKLPSTYLESGRHYTLTIAINADKLDFVIDIVRN